MSMKLRALICVIHGNLKSIQI